jgi:hypothetical protein
LREPTNAVARDIPADVADQLEKELKIIEALDYPGYS